MKLFSYFGPYVIPVAFLAAFSANAAQVATSSLPRFNASCTWCYQDPTVNSYCVPGWSGTVNFPELADQVTNAGHTWRIPFDQNSQPQETATVQGFGGEPLTISYSPVVFANPSGTLTQVSGGLSVWTPTARLDAPTQFSRLQDLTLPGGAGYFFNLYSHGSNINLNPRYQVSCAVKSVQ